MPPAPRGVFSGITSLMRRAVGAQPTLLSRQAHSPAAVLTGESKAPLTPASSRQHSTAVVAAAPRPIGVLLPPPLSTGESDTSLSSLLLFLKAHLIGCRVQDHDVEFIKRALAHWQPRREEYETFIKWDAENPHRYVRSAVHACDELDVLLMCWPAGSCSPTHCHGGSSCWVRAVEGQVHEVRYAADVLEDGRDGSEPLPAPKVTVLHPNGGPSTSAVAYINDAEGVHSVENRTNLPALSLHVYAPGLRTYRTLDEAGRVVWLKSRID
eukprot:GGOE01007221.1.p1 GENE.GGOE01007221.1~~GGOE01007221.1.p1  ORF type:complete len:280 (+),score=58.49 GGOE01007221.1:38-841(+)